MTPSPASPEASGPDEARPEPRPRVLIVDPRGQLGTLLEQAFTRRGWSTCHAQDGREVLRGLAHEPPTAVVAELEGGELDGLELAQLLALLPQRPALLLYSLRATPSDLDEPIRQALGIDIFLPRPCLPAEVVERLENLLHGARAAVAEGRAAT